MWDWKYFEITLEDGKSIKYCENAQFFTRATTFNDKELLYVNLYLILYLLVMKF